MEAPTEGTAYWNECNKVMWKSCGTVFKGCSPNFVSEKPTDEETLKAYGVEDNIYTLTETNEAKKLVSNWSLSAEPDNLNDATSVIGMVLGFGVFFIAYVYTVIQIFISIKADKLKYEEDIENDKVSIESLGLKVEDFAEDLKIRLAGEKNEDLGDDQLMGEASKLTAKDYDSYQV